MQIQMRFITHTHTCPNKLYCNVNTCLSLSLYLQKEILIEEIRAKTDKVVELEKHVEEVSGVCV